MLPMFSNYNSLSTRLWFQTEDSWASRQVIKNYVSCKQVSRKHKIIYKIGSWPWTYTALIQGWQHGRLLQKQVSKFRFGLIKIKSITINEEQQKLFYCTVCPKCSLNTLMKLMLKLMFCLFLVCLFSFF